MFHILVVDDDKNTRLLFKAVLQAENYTVFTADNGEAALEIMEREHIDLVVLDVMMPGMSGYEVCAVIREFSNVPILFLTAKSAEDDRISAYKSGGDDFLSKPFSQAEFLAKVSSLLRRGLSCPPALKRGNSPPRGLAGERSEIYNAYTQANS